MLLLDGAPLRLRAFCLQDWFSWESFCVALTLKLKSEEASEAGEEEVAEEEEESWGDELHLLEATHSAIPSLLSESAEWCKNSPFRDIERLLPVGHRNLIRSLFKRRQLQKALALMTASTAAAAGGGRGGDLFASLPYAQEAHFLMLRLSPIVRADIECGVPGRGDGGGDEDERAARFAQRVQRLRSVESPMMPGLAALVSAFPTAFLDGIGEGTAAEKALAEHYGTHRSVQLAAIEELRQEVENPPPAGLLPVAPPPRPFWSRRLFIYQPAFLTVLILKKLDPAKHAAAVSAWRVGDPELHELVMKHRKGAFRRAAARISTEEQHRVWASLVSVDFGVANAPAAAPDDGGLAVDAASVAVAVEGEGRGRTFTKEALLGASANRSTRTLSAAVLPETACSAADPTPPAASSRRASTVAADAAGARIEAGIAGTVGANLLTSISPSWLALRKTLRSSADGALRALVSTIEADARGREQQHVRWIADHALAALGTALPPAFAEAVQTACGGGVEPAQAQLVAAVAVCRAEETAAPPPEGTSSALASLGEARLSSLAFVLMKLQLAQIVAGMAQQVLMQYMQAGAAQDPAALPLVQALTVVAQAHGTPGLAALSFLPLDAAQEEAARTQGLDAAAFEAQGQQVQAMVSAQLAPLANLVGAICAAEEEATTRPPSVAGEEEKRAPLAEEDDDRSTAADPSPSPELAQNMQFQYYLYVAHSTLHELVGAAAAWLAAGGVGGDAESIMLGEAGAAAEFAFGEEAAEVERALTALGDTEEATTTTEQLTAFYKAVAELQGLLPTMDEGGIQQHKTATKNKKKKWWRRRPRKKTPAAAADSANEQQQQFDSSMSNVFEGRGLPPEAQLELALVRAHVRRSMAACLDQMVAEQLGTATQEGTCIAQALRPEARLALLELPQPQPNAAAVVEMLQSQGQHFAFQQQLEAQRAHAQNAFDEARYEHCARARLLLGQRDGGGEAAAAALANDPFAEWAADMQFLSLLEMVRRSPNKIAKVYENEAAFPEMAAAIRAHEAEFLNATLNPEQRDAVAMVHDGMKIGALLELRGSAVAPEPAAAAVAAAFAPFCAEVKFLSVRQNVAAATHAMQMPTLQAVLQQLMMGGEGELATAIAAAFQTQPQAAMTVLAAPLNPLEETLIANVEAQQKAVVRLRRRAKYGAAKRGSEALDDRRGAISNVSLLELMHTVHSSAGDRAAASDDDGDGDNGDDVDDAEDGAASGDDAREAEIRALVTAVDLKFVSAAAHHQSWEVLSVALCAALPALLPTELDRLQLERTCQVFLHHLSPEAAQVANSPSFLSVAAVLTPCAAESLPCTSAALVATFVETLLREIGVLQAAHAESGSGGAAKQEDVSGGIASDRGAFSTFLLDGNLLFMLWAVVSKTARAGCVYRMMQSCSPALALLVFDHAAEFAQLSLSYAECTKLGTTLRAALRACTVRLNKGRCGDEGEFDPPALLVEYEGDEQFARLKLEAWEAQRSRAPERMQSLMLRMKTQHPLLHVACTATAAHLDDFVNRPLDVAAQQSAWSAHLSEFYFTPVQRVLQAGAKSPLGRAVAVGDAEAVRGALAQLRAASSVAATAHLPPVVFGPDGGGLTTPLLDATLTGRTDIVELLVDAGAMEADFVDGSGRVWPPLHAYLASRDAADDGAETARMVTCLAELGADVGLEVNGFTPLLLCCMRGLLLGTTTLLRGGECRRSTGGTWRADANAVSSLYRSAPLHAAIQAGNVAMSEALLVGGASPSKLKVDAEQANTPLVCALATKSEELVELLLAKGAAVDQPSRYAWDRTEVVKYLGRRGRERSAALGDVDRNIRVTPLGVAASSGDTAMVRRLLSHGADARFCDPIAGFTPLHLASNAFGDSSADALGTVQLLLDAGADVDAQNYQGTTPLYLAAQKKDTPLARLLLAAGARPSLTNNDGEGPAEIAAAFGALDFLELLRESGGTGILTVPDKKGRTPLFAATAGGKLEAMQYIVAAVADGGDVSAAARACVKERDAEGNTGFLIACAAGQFESMMLYLSWDPGCVGDVNDNGESALMIAARIGNGYLSLWLLSQGADPLATDDNRLSVLHHAAAGGDIDTVAALCWNGATALALSSVFGLSELTDTAAAHADDGLSAVDLGQVVVTPVFYAAATRKMEVVTLLLNGVPSPLAMHPLTLVPTPGPGFLCNIRGTPLPFPGQYYSSTDGADFTVCVEAFEEFSAREEDGAAAGGAVSGGELVDLMGDEERAELLCAAAEAGDLTLATQLVVSFALDVSLPCLAGGKVPLQFVDLEAHPAVAELLVQHGATMFIKAAEGSRAATRQRLGTAGFGPLHRLVWRGAPAGILPAGLLGGLQSDDDPLGRTPLHHAAALDALDWVLVLAEYGAADTALDAEGWSSLHAAAYAGSARAVELLLRADAAAEVAGDGGEGRRRWFNCDVQAETLCGGEDAWDLALRGRQERTAATAAGRRTALAKAFGGAGAAFGITVGLLLDLTLSEGPFTPPASVIGLVAGLPVGLLAGYAAGRWRESARRRSGAAGAAVNVQASERAALMSEYPRVVELLKSSGAMTRRHRLLHVKLPRTARFGVLCLVAGFLLPFVLLRSLLEGSNLKTFFLHLGQHRAPGEEGCQLSPCAKRGSALLRLGLLLLPVVVLSGACRPDTARALSLVFASVVCLMLAGVLAQWTRAADDAKEEAEEEEEKEEITIRRNRANAAVAFALLLEAGQMCQISLGVATPYWQRFAPGIFNAFEYVSLQLAALKAEQGADASAVATSQSSVALPTSIPNLGVTEAMQFWSHVGFALVWGLVTAKLAGSCIVRGSASLRYHYRFVASDFYGRSTLRPILVPLLTGGAFLPIMVSLLGVLQCGAFTESESVACFEGAHLLQATAAMLALLFFAPTAFLVSMTFLQKQDDDSELDIRSNRRFETLLTSCKSALSVAVTLCPTVPGVLVAVSTVTSLTLCVAAAVRPPCENSWPVTVIRTALYALTVVASLSGIAALTDDSSSFAVWVFICGSALTMALAWTVFKKQCGSGGLAPSLRKKTPTLASQGAEIELLVTDGKYQALKITAQDAVAARLKKMRASSSSAGAESKTF